MSFGWSFQNKNLEYSGYPVLSASDHEVVILAPNINSFGLYTLVSNKDIVFIPSLWSMKNIRTHLEEGALQADTGKTCYGMIRYLSANLYALVISNDDTFDADDMKMDLMGVCSGDELILGEVFPVEHEGSHTIVGFGQNVIIFENSNGNGVETESSIDLNGDYQGLLKQMFEISSGTDEPIKIRARESIKVGSQITIPSGKEPWFDERMIGTHVVTDFGFINDFTGFIQGNPNDVEHTTFWLEVETSKNAPSETVHTSYIDDVKHYKDPNKNYAVVVGSAITQDDRRYVFTSPVQNEQHGLSKGTSIYPISKITPTASKEVGIDGYTTLGGLVKAAHSKVDGIGYDEGYKAAGTKISIMPPVPKFIRLRIEIDVDPSTSVAGIAGVVRSSTMGYINSLKTGENVIISSIVAVCSKISGVTAVKVFSNEEDENKIAVAEDQKAVIKLEDIEVN